MKKIFALVISALLVLSCFAALAEGTDPFAATSTVNVTVTNLLEGDTLYLYKIGTPAVDAHNEMSITWDPTELADLIEDATTEDWDYSPTATLQAGIAAKIADGSVSVTGDGDYHQEVATGETSATIAVAPGYYLALVRQGEASGQNGAKRIYQNMLINAIPVPNATTGEWESHAAVTATVKYEDEEIVKKQKEYGGTEYVATTVEGYKFGDYIPFEITTHIPSYPNNSKVATFEITDTPAGLKIVNNSTYPVKVFVGGTEVTDPTNKFEVTVTDGNLSIVFEKNYILQNPNAAVVVTYSAELLGNDNDVEVDITNNTAKIKYNNNPDETTYQEPPTDIEQKTFNFTLVKEDADDSAKTLAGAEFTLWDAAENGNEIKLIKDGDVYRPIKAEDNTTEGVNIVVNADGTATVVGLAKGTYYLQEEVAPAGYKKLTARVAAAANETTSVVGIDHHVPNTPGVSLPTTGGIGTTLFYIGGSILVLAAVILLVTKKRMSAND